MRTIPIMRPKLPSLERLTPYLTAIDASRVYTNFGPLAHEFEERLAARFGLAIGTVTTVANATIGLVLALAAQGARPGTLCAMPAWTFVASAHAATMAGLIPYFLDVDAETWALEPNHIGDRLAKAPAAVGAVMPVAPFGRPIDIAQWDDFRSRTGLPVVIDAAAAFDTIVPGASPSVISLHATKAFCVGEGGFVVSTNPSIIKEVRTRSNFGFMGSREAAVPATNAKFSEYHAAVGLAALDEWANTRSEWMTVARAYRKALPDSNWLRFQEGFGDSWVASTCVLSMANGADRVESEIARTGIETRRWWARGAHAHPATASFPRGQLPATASLVSSVLALPLYRDLPLEDIQKVCEVVTKATGA